jgi:hypothetical protein
MRSPGPGRPGHAAVSPSASPRSRQGRLSLRPHPSPGVSLRAVPGCSCGSGGPRPLGWGHGDLRRLPAGRGSSGAPGAHGGDGPADALASHPRRGPAGGLSCGRGAPAGLVGSLRRDCARLGLPVWELSVTLGRGRGDVTSAVVGPLRRMGGHARARAASTSRIWTVLHHPPCAHAPDARRFLARSRRGILPAARSRVAPAAGATVARRRTPLRTTPGDALISFFGRYCAPL